MFLALVRRTQSFAGKGGKVFGKEIAGGEAS